MTLLTISALLWASGLPPFEPDFRSLFDGQSLEGWIGDTSGHVVRDGAITVTPQGTNLYTSEKFADFVLRFEFKLTPGANNGLGIRTPPSGDAACGSKSISFYPTAMLSTELLGWILEEEDAF